LILTGEEQSTSHALLLDRNSRLLEWATIRLGNGSSNDLPYGLLGGPDIHQDDASGLIPTGEEQSTSYALVLDRNSQLLEGASIRLGNGSSNDLPYVLLNFPDSDQDDSSWAVATRDDPRKPYALILEGNMRLLKEASLHLCVGGSVNLAYGLNDGHNFTTSVSHSAPGVNVKRPILPGKRGTELKAEDPTQNDDRTCGNLLSDEGKNGGEA
jgi:hypothetical protein